MMRWHWRLIPALATAAPPAVSDTEKTLRQSLAWQVALDRVGFSPGLIDGNPGPKTAIATQEFQRVRGLPQTGKLDPATAQALGVNAGAVLGRYTIVQDDLDEIGPLPASWKEKARLDHLGHEALENVLAEMFHCSTGLLATLNPGRNINRLRPGDRVVVAIVQEPESFPKAGRIDVNLAEKVIRVIGRDSKLIALFHCSIAKDKEKRPSGESRVTGVAFDPTYTFRPEMWPEVKEKVPGPLTIPPGPRNPVGRCWVSLSLPGYGMHGTPNPELIGKTGSHGCFRLANWDAIRLGKMVEAGTPVRFSDQPSALAQR
jgi:lipoprotein-anchoring transpeptidase ErfK/SrfK